MVLFFRLLSSLALRGVGGTGVFFALALRSWAGSCLVLAKGGLLRLFDIVIREFRDCDDWAVSPQHMGGFPFSSRLLPEYQQCTQSSYTNLLLGIYSSQYRCCCRSFPGRTGHQAELANRLPSGIQDRCCYYRGWFLLGSWSWL